MLDPRVEKAVDAALELAEKGRLRPAGDAMSRLLQEYPRDHLVCFGMGTLHAMKKEFPEAIRYFDRAIAIFPYFTDAYFNKGVACQQQLDVGGAIRAFRKVVEVGDPDDPPVKKARSLLDDLAATIQRTEGVALEAYLESMELFDRAYALLEQGAWSRALAGFRASAAKNDRNAPTHGNLGLCLAKLGRKAEALAELDRALEIDPRYEPAKINRAAVERMEEGRPLESADILRVDYSREKWLQNRGQ